MLASSFSTSRKNSAVPPKRDLSSPKLIFLKAALFLIICLFCVGVILVGHFEWRLFLLLACAIWAFCRALCFAFYVIGKYVDPSFRFSGPGSFLPWCLRRRSDK